MTTSSRSTHRKMKYHIDAYKFVFAALQYTQQRLRRGLGDPENQAQAHVTGQELSEGIRELATKQFGWMARTVFKTWGVTSTEDFGRIVFDLIERGEMRKTDHDRMSDFFDVYDFRQAFDEDYQVDTSAAFER